MNRIQKMFFVICTKIMEDVGGLLGDAKREHNTLLLLAKRDQTLRHLTLGKSAAIAYHELALRSAMLER